MTNQDITDIEADLIEDNEDKQRLTNLERSLLGVEPVVEGYKLRPCTAGAMAVLQRAKIKLIYGDMTSLLYDAAAYVLICNADEEISKASRRAAFGDFPEYVLAWLDKQGPSAHTALNEAATGIADSLTSYWSSLTKSATSNDAVPGNVGGRTG
jgi:hypothetical protein